MQAEQFRLFDAVHRAYENGDLDNSSLYAHLAGQGALAAEQLHHRGDRESRIRRNRWPQKLGISMGSGREDPYRRRCKGLRSGAQFCCESPRGTGFAAQQRPNFKKVKRRP